MGDLEFRPDLFQGTARYYDQFRRPYPGDLIDDLVARSGADGEGSLLDLACGTGQLTFALHARFARTWAVDSEPEMIEVVREKSHRGAISGIRAVVSAAQDLRAPADSFDLAVIGNAFHRLPRQAVAAKLLRWLRPGGFVALVWTATPWLGDAPWQQAMSATLDRWMTTAGARDRIPAGWDTREPDLAVLTAAGFQAEGTYQFPDACDWTARGLVGFVYSTSFLSLAALGGHAQAFEADLLRELSPYQSNGPLRQAGAAAYELARRPGRPDPSAPDDDGDGP